MGWSWRYHTRLTTFQGIMPALSFFPMAPAIGLGAARCLGEGLDVGEHCVEGDFEWLGAALNLGEEEAALKSGEGG